MAGLACASKLVVTPASMARPTTPHPRRRALAVHQVSPPVLEFPPPASACPIYLLTPTPLHGALRLSISPRTSGIVSFQQGETKHTHRHASNGRTQTLSPSRLLPVLAVFGAENKSLHASSRRHGLRARGRKQPVSKPANATDWVPMDFGSA